MKEVTLELTRDEWDEIEHYWDYWSDESFVIHAAYIFRAALIRHGYMKSVGETQ